MAKYICPYCFSENDFSEVEFRCVNKFCGRKERDEPYARYLGLEAGGTPEANATFRPGGRAPLLFRKNYMPMWANCPHCGEKTAFRICPKCHNELPEGIQDHEDMIIAIVGSRDTGKTHFISVLINELQKRICPKVLDGTFNPMNDDTFRHYRDNFYNKVYVEKQLQPLTASGAHKGETVVRKPLIYELMIPNGGNPRKFTFIFYDTAGEDMKDLSVMRTVNKYICKASGIIFLLDPLQIEELRRNMTEEEIRTSSSIRAAEIEPQEMMIQRIAKLIREEKGYRWNHKINVPTAVAFSKFDILKRFFPKGSLVLEPSAYLREGRLDKSEWFTVNSEIEAMLLEWGALSFVKAVENNFSNYTYFSVSALGQQPVLPARGGPKSLKSVPMPHRVEDPFLWLMKENGILKEI